MQKGKARLSLPTNPDLMSPKAAMERGLDVGAGNLHFWKLQYGMPSTWIE